MRFIPVAVCISLLIIASALPIRNVKDDLKDLAEQTQLEINRNTVNQVFVMAKLIIDKMVIDDPEMEKWNKFVEEWSSKNESLVQDAKLAKKFKAEVRHLLSTKPSRKFDSSTRQQLKNTLFDMHSKFLNRVADQYAAFEIKATDLIRVAKEAKYTDDSLDKVYDSFVQAVDLPKRRHYFTNLLSYLNGKVVDL